MKQIKSVEEGNKILADIRKIIIEDRSFGFEKINKIAEILEVKIETW